MPYPIRNLIDGQSKLTVVRPDDKVQNALDLMIEHDYSQLPVVDNEYKPLGIITNESILKALNNFDLTLDELVVNDAIDKVYSYRPEDDLFDLLNNLQTTYAVLVIDGDGKLVGIVTDYDSAEYFRQRAEDLMLVADIEMMIRNLIEVSFTDQTGTIDNDELAQTIKFKHRNGETKKFDELNLYEYIELFLNESCWDFYKPTFTLQPHSIRKLLDKVRKIRNKLAHFRDEICTRERSQLQSCVDWLTRHHDTIMDKIQQPIQTTDKEPDKDAEDETDLFDGDIGPNESRYAKLAIYLQEQSYKNESLQLTFDRIEQIIDSELPASAYKHKSWWANDPVNHVQSQQWLSADWKVASVNLSEQRVKFSRIRERGKLYIEFFNMLLDELDKKESDFQAKERRSPNGKHYLRVADMPTHRHVGTLSFSFTRYKELRVQLDIHKGDQVLNKRIFDSLYGRKEIIEDGFGKPLIWQRLDDNRKSRIAVSHPGAIDEPEEKLKELVQWAVETMIKFEQAIRQPLIEVVDEIFNDQ